MSELISFFVQGTPVGKGSMKGFPIHRANGTTGVAITNANPKTKTWQNQVSLTASQVVTANGFYEDGEIGYEVYLRFYRTKPKSMPKRKTLWLTKYDLDKLIRIILDSLTDVAFPDDAQVVRIDAEKAHAEDNHLPEHVGQPGVMVVVKKRRELPR